MEWWLYVDPKRSPANLGEHAGTMSEGRDRQQEEHAPEKRLAESGPILVVADTIVSDVHRELVRSERSARLVSGLVPALRELRRYRFDEVLLDSAHCQVDALELVVAIRDTGTRVPILILPAEGEEGVWRALDGEPNVFWLDGAARGASLRGALERGNQPPKTRWDMQA